MKIHPTPGQECRLRGPGRLLLVGGLLVPAVVVGSALTALPAAASPDPVVSIGSKHLLAVDLAAATATPATLHLTTDLVPADTANDTVALPASATATLDLAGHALDLDTISLGSGSTLHVVDSVGTGALTVDGVAPTTPLPTNTAGIALATNAALDIDGAAVQASGGTGAAGIGTAGASTVTNARVTVEGAAVVTATGGTGANGVGGGLLGSGVSLHIGGTAKVTAHSGALAVPNGVLPSAIGVGAAVGALTVDPAASLTIPADSVLRIPVGLTAVNNGLLDVEGSVLGGGFLRNAGDLVSLNGTLTTLLSGIQLLGDLAVYRVVVDLAGGVGVAVPVTVDVIGNRLLQLDAWLPTKTGLLFGGWAVNGVAVSDATDLATVAVSNVANGVTTNLVNLQAVWIEPISIASGNSLTVVNGSLVNWQLLTGGTSPTVTLIGALPAGLVLNNAGFISGVAQNVGVYNFTLEFAGPAQSAIDKGYQLVIQDVASNSSSSSNSNSNNNSNSNSNNNSNSNSSSNSSTTANSGASSSSSNSSTSTTTNSDSGNSSSTTTTTNNDSASNSSNSSNSSSSTSSTSNSSTTNNNSGISQALTKQSSMTAQYAKSVRWSLKGSSKVAAKYTFSGKLPHGVRYDAKSVRIVGTPTQVGKYSFSVKAVSKSGSVVRHYSLVVPKVVVFGHRVSSTTTTSGSPVTVTLTKLQVGEHFTLSMSGKVVYRGVAKRAGTTKVTVHVEHTSVDRTEKLTISTSRSLKSSVYSSVDVIELTTLAKTKHLVTTVKGGVLTVTGLGPNERVRLLVLGVVVATGTADANGVFVSRKLKPGKTVTVQGSTKGRSALCRVVG